MAKGTKADRAPVVALRADTNEEDEGIRKGDYLLVRPQPKAAAGATVVAFVDGRLALRRLVRGREGRAELLPVSPRLLPLVLPAERAEIVGPLVGVLRRRPGRRTGSPIAPLPPPAVREVARDLRALRDCYAGTSVPRLRDALLREARARLATLRERPASGR